MIIIIVSLLMTLIILMMNSYNIYVAAQQQLHSPETSTVSNVYKKVENSIVGIVTPLTAETTDTVEPIYEGSGFVYDKIENSVHIVTNEHVVRDFQTVKVVFVDGSAYTADVIGIDPEGDLAVLQIVRNETQQPQVPEPLEIGNSSTLQVGEQVLAIGNPFLAEESFTNLLTTGVISKLGVNPSVDDEGVFFNIPNAIVTDAGISGGSSGGPLLNMQGKVIGILTASENETPCCTYAIPSNRITRIVPTLIENGEYIYPYLGIEFANVTPDLLEQALEDSPDNLNGVLVTQIDKDSPAHKAGINASIINQFGNITGGDIITAVDGNPIIEGDEFSTYVREHKQVDDNITLAVYRNGDFLRLNATLEASPY
jgi:S1-C subfamily serine protease